MAPAWCGTPCNGSLMDPRYLPTVWRMVHYVRYWTAVLRMLNNPLEDE